MQGMKKLEDIFNHEGKVADDLLNIAKVPDEYTFEQ